MKTEQMKQLIFIGIIILIALALWMLVFYSQQIFINLPWIVLLLAVAVIMYSYEFLIVLKEYERAVVFRIGKFNKVAGPGWVFLLPGVDSYSKVDLRIQTLDIPPQDVITKGNIQLKIDAVIYMKVKEDKDSVKNSVIKVDDYKKAARLYVGSIIRDVIGGMDLNVLISNVEDLNEELKTQLVRISKEWGVEIQSVELQDIKIPKEVLDSMHLQKAAEQKKLARMHGALAHKAEIEAVQESAGELSDKALAYYYIKALEKMAEGKATKLVFPIEISRLAETISGKMAGAVKPKEGQSAEQLILENKEKIAELFGVDLANNLIKAVKEKKEKKSAVN